jgi:hypothetical protein
MQKIFETLMMVAFGLSWPFTIIKSYKARTNKGISLLFLILIEFGYICGIVAKFVGHDITYVLFFYVLNFLMIIADLLLYIRNYQFDKFKIDSMKNEGIIKLRSGK